MRQIEIIQAIAQHGGVSAAARALNLSQPPVTRFLQQVERDYGTPVFERTARGMIPTAFGEALLQRSRAISAELQGLELDAKSLAGTSGGRLAVGMTPAITSPIPRALVRMQAEMPALQMTIEEGLRVSLLSALRAGDLDVVLTLLPQHAAEDQFSDEILLYNQLSVVTRWDHPLHRRRKIGVSDLLDYGWVLPPSDLPARSQLESAFHQLRILPPRHAIEIASLRLAREIILASDNITIMVDDAIRHDIGSKLLKVLNTPLHLPMRPITMVTRRLSQPTRLLSRFVSLLKEEALSYRPERRATNR